MHSLAKATVGALLLAARCMAQGAASTGTGPGSPGVYKEEPGLPNHTIYYPQKMTAFQSIPVLVWGNGGCSSNALSHRNFLIEIASHGVIAIASGTPNGGGGSTTSALMKSAMDWAVQNSGKGSWAQMNASRIASAGMSCGGIEAYDVSGDPRVVSIGIFNSGHLDASLTTSMVAKLTKPIFYFLGGSGDIAYQNGLRDYRALPASTPAWMGNQNVGHGGTYSQNNGGSFGKAGANWARCVLRLEKAGCEYFTGGQAEKDGWVTEKRSLEPLTAAAT